MRARLADGGVAVHVSAIRVSAEPAQYVAGAGLGSYLFWLDFEGHISDARVGEALMGLRRVCADVRYLGSYARADQIGPEVRRGTHDADFTEAAAWLESTHPHRPAPPLTVSRLP
ncbi:ACT domain-containing protein [Saccharopolyspora mangrovi]|uniref:Prephenate dehydratase n=1 Tax=Saccharopolyspora mangrovi TaxID=3082379 RepID=A0ABU6AF44_9PSEU|nr:hypothetical protein [Saccharopolyspora sp. S2-29]MEB3370082.1 hypothetical protein [Saccharopolyspora sp. S2-29]